MSLIQEQIAALQRAEQDVLDALKDGPLTTGRLIQQLGHNGLNFALTQMIGDSAGEFDNHPHQLALTDLVDSGRIVWWKDDKFDVWYGIAGADGVPEKEQCGDNSPAVVAVRKFVAKLCLALEAAGAQADAVFDTVVEVGMDGYECCSVHIDADRGIVEVTEYDFVVGAGSGEEWATVQWPCDDVESLAATTIDAILARPENKTK